MIYYVEYDYKMNTYPYIVDKFYCCLYCNSMFIKYI